MAHAASTDAAWSSTAAETRHWWWWGTVWTGTTTCWHRRWIKRTLGRRPSRTDDCRCLSMSTSPSRGALQRISRPLGSCTVLPMTLPDVRIVLSVQLTRRSYLFLAGWYFQISGTLETTGPVLEWNTSVSQVWVLECYNLVAYTHTQFIVLIQWQNISRNKTPSDNVCDMVPEAHSKWDTKSYWQIIPILKPCYKCYILAKNQELFEQQNPVQNSCIIIATIFTYTLGLSPGRWVRTALLQ